MLALRPAIMAILSPFAPVASRPVWQHVQVLLVGAILRVLGLDHLSTFQTYHRVLNRPVWSSLALNRILLGLPVTTFAPDGPLVIGIDETIERRRGTKISAKGIYLAKVCTRQAECQLP